MAIEKIEGLDISIFDRAIAFIQKIPPELAARRRQGIPMAFSAYKEIPEGAQRVGEPMCLGTQNPGSVLQQVAMMDLHYYDLVATLTDRVLAHGEKINGYCVVERDGGLTYVQALYIEGEKEN